MITIQTTTINLETKRIILGRSNFGSGRGQSRIEIDNRKLTKGVDVGKLMTRESQLLIDFIRKKRKLSKIHLENISRLGLPVKKQGWLQTQGL